MPIITISRQFGAGGSSVARLLADDLAAELVDESLIAEVARRLELPERYVAKTDERPETLADRLLSTLGTLRYLAPVTVIPWRPPHGDRAVEPRWAIVNLTQEVIREVARLGSAVVVGRGGAFILRNHPNAFHVFLQAADELRVKAVMARLMLDEQAAARRMRETDANRAAYIRQLYGADWRDSANYDLVVNTGRLGFVRAADLILAATGRGSVAEPDRLGGPIALAHDRASLADRAELLARLGAFACTVMGTLDQDQLWAQLVDGVAAVMPADIVALTVLDRATGGYRLRAVRGVDESVVGLEVLPGEGVTGRAIRDRATVVVERLPRAAYPPAVRDAPEADVLTALGLPLIREGTVVGALMIGRTDLSRPFTDVERDALELLGAQAALAIANAFLHAEVAELAIRDPLTGLHNRRFLDATLERLIAGRRRLEPADRRPLAAILFDLDHFGRFNKDHGHQAGDATLRAFAELLSGRVRASDIVARYGGEEFLIILDGAGVDAAIVVADEIRRHFESLPLRVPNGTSVHATVSAGAAALDEHEASFEALLRAADAGLFIAKRGGRNRVASA